MPIEHQHIYFDQDEGSGGGIVQPIHGDSDETGAKEFENAAKAYPELGNEKHGLNVWGDIKITDESYLFGGPPDEFGPIGSYVNLYNSPEIIKRGFTGEIKFCAWKAISQGKSSEDLVLADIGGYDGFLLDTVIKQLKGDGISGVTGINIEADPKGEALPNMQAKIESGEYSAKLKAVKANILTEVPLEPESVDFAISRCAIQYSTKDQHIQFLRNIAKMLKEDGLLILQFPGVENDPEGIYTEIHREISKIVTRGTEFKRDFPDRTISSRFAGRHISNTDLQNPEFISGLLHDIDTVLEVGFRTNGYNMVEWPMSPESWGYRFGLNTEQIEEIHQIYAQFQESCPDLFIEEEGKLCLRSQLIRAMFRKATKNEQAADLQVKKQLETMLPNDEQR